MREAVVTRGGQEAVVAGCLREKISRLSLGGEDETPPPSTDTQSMLITGSIARLEVSHVVCSHLGWLLPSPPPRQG